MKGMNGSCSCRQEGGSWVERWTVGLAMLLVYVPSLYAVNRYVSEPYMDEIFHVPQTQRYSLGDWFTWDSKITTFPGSYVIGAMFAQMHAYICSLAKDASLENVSRILNNTQLMTVLLRSVSFMLSLGSAIVFMELKKLIFRNDSEKYGISVPSPKIATSMGACMSLFPVHYFYSFLWYTDSASTFFLLCTWLTIEHHSIQVSKYYNDTICNRSHSKNSKCLGARFLCSFVMAIISIAMRQTNAVWVAFFGARAVFLDSVSSFQGNVSKEKKSKNDNISVHWCMDFLFSVWKRRKVLLCIISPLVLPLLSFAVFVKVNGGVVIGDKEHHKPVLHWVQPFYCSIYFVLNVMPMFLGRNESKHQKLRWSTIVPACSAIAALAWLAVRNGTLVHPFLLADNRHYTFYLWRKIVNRYWWMRYALIPGYVFAMYSIWGKLRAAKRHPLEILLFAGATCMVLIPAHLIEFRYFTVPCILLLLLMDPPRTDQTIATIVVFLTMNTLVLYMFTQRPFTWNDGSTARFMW